MPVAYLINKIYGRNLIERISWGDIEFLNLAVPGAILAIIFENTTFVVRRLFDVFPFLFYSYWGDSSIDIRSSYNYSGKKYAQCLFLAFGSIICLVILVILEFAIILSPFFIGVRVFVNWLIMQFSGITYISGLALDLLRSSNITYWLTIHHITIIAIQDWLVNMLFKLLSFFLLAESGILYWINVLCFYILWGFVIYFSFLLLLHLMDRERNGFDGFEVFIQAYGNLLEKMAKFLKKKLGALGELVIVGVTLVWLGWPLVVAYYVRYIVVIIPCVVLTGFLVFLGHKTLKAI